MEENDQHLPPNISVPQSPSQLIGIFDLTDIQLMYNNKLLTYVTIQVYCQWLLCLRRIWMEVGVDILHFGSFFG